jgi:transcription antitermination factor NusG
MPLLTLESFLFPDDLFSSGDIERGHAGDWWVLHTRPRVEKTLARRFLDRQIPFFLPLYDRQWRKRGRLFLSHLPLFPGYLFVRGSGQVRLAALETNQVARVIPVPDQAQLHADLGRIYRLVTSGKTLIPEQRLIPGSWVEIISGALEGLEGKIIRSSKGLKLFVEVQFLQRGVSVEIESSMIQPSSRQHMTAASD